MMRNRIASRLVLAAVMLVAAAAIRWAQGHHVIGPDVAARAMQVLIGLMVAFYGNVMPKDIGRWRGSARSAAAVQSALRVGGWSLTSAGLAYAGLWAFTPVAFATTAGIVVVAAATLVTAGYGARAVSVCRRADDRATIS
jgi:hypothetical protein